MTCVLSTPNAPQPRKAGMCCGSRQTQPQLNHRMTISSLWPTPCVRPVDHRRPNPTDRHLFDL